MDAALSRYLDLLGVVARPPGEEALAQLVSAQMHVVPFENVSKLWHMSNRALRSIPSFESYLDGIEESHFGGTCYSNNYYFHRLLVGLGYDVKLCGADMADREDVHMVSLVSTGGHEFLVDVGYAAPFPYPLPRDLGRDLEIVSGVDRYVLRPQDSKGRSRMELYRDSRLKHGYLVNPRPKQLAHFEHVIASSFREEATFMNALLVTRFFEDRFVSIRNLCITETHGSRFETRTLSSRDDLVDVVSRRFGMPSECVAEVVSRLEKLEDPWGRD